ncbi:transcription factor IIF subunit [Starmerella bacillaris]|uniref:Transcription factor IIF subunit n=1 Tax=Starmerella bacillaris TaxID=1247836 RepID=A0AAV5RFG6_STABA|nr:transcription factor IIF subunit [Starmerella bacillaris]
MRKKFESADPLRRGVRRPRPAMIRNSTAQLAQRNAQLNKPPLNPFMKDVGPKPEESNPGSFQEFALKMCNEEDIINTRYHVLKFHSKEPVDPAANFVSPIRLHRRDPKQLQTTVGNGEDEFDSEDGMEDEENEIKPQTAEAKAQAVLGEDGKSEQKRRPFGKKRKTRQVYGGEKNEAARKLRYEEHYPWVMEDFDNTNTWVSSYEAAQSNNYAILTYDAASNGFKVIPIEKFYKMNPVAKYATLSLEDAEERMEGINVFKDRWLMSRLQPKMQAPEIPPATMRMRTVVGGEERQHKYNLDEEMDYDDKEMFDDDEGAPILDGPEEELKEAEERIKREQLKANELLNRGADEDIDDLFEEESSKENKQGKKLRRALRALEKNQYYDSDDDENPYISSPDESDSNDELNQDSNALELGSTVKREEEDLALPMMTQFRKKHINRDSLPPGEIVLQLPPQMLAKFTPGEWNPDVKRTTEAPSVEDPRLLTREDVRSRIKSGETEIKQLLNALRPKLAQHKDNVDRLRQFVKEVARSKDRKLYLRN